MEGEQVQTTALWKNKRVVSMSLEDTFRKIVHMRCLMLSPVFFLKKKNILFDHTFTSILLEIEVCFQKIIWSI